MSAAARATPVVPRASVCRCSIRRSSKIPISATRARCRAKRRPLRCSSCGWAVRDRRRASQPARRAGAGEADGGDAWKGGDAWRGWGGWAGWARGRHAARMLSCIRSAASSRCSAIPGYATLLGRTSLAPIPPILPIEPFQPIPLFPPIPLDQHGFSLAIRRGGRGVPPGRRVARRTWRRVRARAAALPDRRAAARLGPPTKAAGGRARARRVLLAWPGSRALSRPGDRRARLELRVPGGNHALERQRFRHPAVLRSPLRRGVHAAARAGRADAQLRGAGDVQRQVLRRAVPARSGAAPRRGAAAAGGPSRLAPRLAPALEEPPGRLPAANARAVRVPPPAL